MKTNLISAGKPSVTLWKKVADAASLDFVNSAVAVYFDKLGPLPMPESVDFDAAILAAKSSIVSRVLSADFLKSLGLPNTDDPRVRAQLEVSFSAMHSRLQVAPLPVTNELSGLQFGVAALVGAVSGILLLAPFTRFVLKTGEVGLLLGAPLGAFLLVFVVWHTARKKLFRQALTALLGGVTLAKMASLVTGQSWISRVWYHLGKRGVTSERIAIFCAVLLVVILATPRRRLDRKQHQEILRTVLTHWLETMILLIGCLGSTSLPSATNDSSEAILLDIVKQVLASLQVAPKNLPAARDEILQHLRKAGFKTNTLNSQPLLWEKELGEKYETWGHIEEGDRVSVEREAVVLDGTVRKKGLVRKQR